MNEQKDIISRLNDILTCEQSETKVGRIDLQQYTNEIYPGVFHEDGRMVATDGFHLIALKADYPADLEGKAIGKDGKDSSASFRGGKFPRWQSVVPITDNNVWKTKVIDFAALSAMVAEAKAHKKIYKKGQIARVTIDKDVCFDLWRFEKFVRVLRANGINELLYNPNVNVEKYRVYPAVVKTDILTAILQPCMPVEEEDLKKPALFYRTL